VKRARCGRIVPGTNGLVICGGLAAHAGECPSIELSEEQRAVLVAGMAKAAEDASAAGASPDSISTELFAFGLGACVAAGWSDEELIRLVRAIAPGTRDHLRLVGAVKL
jgi:hypothetical protein